MGLDPYIIGVGTGGGGGGGGQPPPKFFGGGVYPPPSPPLFLSVTKLSNGKSRVCVEYVEH